MNRSERVPIQGWVLVRGITILQARVGLGKTTLSASLLTRLTTEEGEAFFQLGQRPVYIGI